jgi:hypothetical protein
LWDGLQYDRAGFFKLIGGDVDLDVADAYLEPRHNRSRTWALNPALDSGATQHLAPLRCFVD